MPLLPRLALATIATGPDPSLAALGWLGGLAERRWRVQHFRSLACPTATGLVSQVSGLPGRHLDAWLMPEPVLRRLFARGAGQADLAVVEGTLDDALSSRQPLCQSPGWLRPIIAALDLPTVAVVPCPGRESFHLPHVPENIDAVFLDGLDSPDDFGLVRRMVALTTKKPVLGALEALPETRAALRQIPRGCALPEEHLGRLAASFLRFADLGAIRSLARRRAFPFPVPEPVRRGTARFRVAYAQDDAFGAYFPDTLEALESLGADLLEFSPLRDERLPDGVDLVMIGCGYPDLHADALAENVSMIAALRCHVCRGQRIYSEGGGTAYLGRSMIIDGRSVPGAGILPFDAALQRDPAPPAQVTRTLTRDCWIGPRGTVVRGYRSSRWRLIPGADPLDCPSCFGSLSDEGDLFFHHHAVGGMIHLHLGALVEVSTAFAGPHPASLNLPTARR
jgi:cobyrinic acid a,c-diamide synthase